MITYLANKCNGEEVHMFICMPGLPVLLYSGCCIIWKVEVKTEVKTRTALLLHTM